MRIDFLAGPEKLPSQRKARGSAHGRAKLNEVAVRKIRDMAFNCLTKSMLCMVGGTASLGKHRSITVP